MTPIVHIGMHKTASSWFQKVFFPRVVGGWVVPRRQIRQWFLEPRAGRFDADATRSALLAEAAGRRPILSEENLSGYPHNGGLGGLVPAMAAARIAAALPDAHVLVLLRKQPSAIAAAYRQYVRSGGTVRAAHYLSAGQRDLGARRHWYKVPLFDVEHFNYSVLLDTYAAHVGRDRVHVFLFEAFVADPPQLVAQIAAALAASLPSDLDTGQVVNPSIPVGSLPLVRLLNRFTRASVLDKQTWLHVPGWNEQRLRFVKWLARQGGPHVTPAQILGVEQVAAIECHFAKTNARLAQKWSLPLRAHGYILDESAT